MRARAVFAPCAARTHGGMNACPVADVVSAAQCNRSSSMIARRVLLSTSLALCAALGLTAHPLSSLACESGPGSGRWELPSGSGTSDGFIDGALYLSTGTTVRYYFN